MPYIRDRVIKGANKNNVDYIVDAHDAYKYYINRWNFLGDSYQGGYDYFMGKYLEPYYYESREDYEKRLRMVAVDNHTKSVVGIYNSFLFRKDVRREFGSIQNDPGLKPFMKDADLDGRSFTAFLRDLSSYAMVYGNCWVVVDKVNSNALTRADELSQEIRPYVSIFTPDNVLDWKYERQPNGLYVLTYLKVKEEVVEDQQYVREYTPEEINVYLVDGDKNSGDIIQSTPNALGKVPAVCVYAQRSPVRGIGVSAIGDIADTQKDLYELSSEMNDIIRLTNHPSLVKTRGTEASAGAGAIIQMEEGLDPGLKPFLLQPNGSSVESIIGAMDKKIESIDRMACLGGIRSVESRRLSGIGLQTEFQMLNARLADFAMNLEHAEEQIWRMWAMYQGKAWDGEVDYPDSFSIQDKANDIAMLKMAKEAGITNLSINARIDDLIFETITEEDASLLPMVHPVITADNKNPHIQEMIMEGFTDTQMLETHPEISQQDIDTAKQALVTNG
tara:strand:+ start:7282 stop:8790 length:1509 start_codon:yes stop_codon:yes gene_type:complete